MKIAMITGSCPPEPCGVGDYTFRLVDALRFRGIDVDVISSNIDWGSFNVRRIASYIAASLPDIVHIQYPSIGFGANLSPQALSILLKPCVVTLHEVSQVHFLRRLSLLPFAVGCERLVFTSDFEMNYARGRVPWLAKKSCVIPIGSAISAPSNNCVKNLDEIIHFGLIRPRKGIEQVIRLASLIKLEGLPLYVRIVGSVDTQQKSYLNQLQSASAGLPILWDLGMPESQVANLLAMSRLAYMPFPDGASERRSSLLALLSNGVATVSTGGVFTTAAMADALMFANTPEGTLRIIKQLLVSPEKLAGVSQKARKYAQRHDWEDISCSHLKLYREVLQQAKPKGKFS